ncbi:zinc finger and BTB domain-containing protein 24 isoform X2 [Bicyclus anynana]|uniref:Zinc finger and BTB domain-containing protein 24 isoform X2 n=1 Tax=Bicyclus anynana TaxID=110368 RepID=A0ABM3LUY9_BICAN|nr:zinc finger and BTB domain-containing protein 24 isoform X2 [Bicyclus anynana]
MNGCFICNKVTLRNVVSIFGELPLKSGKSLVTVISEIIDKKIIKGSVHSEVLCKKCQKFLLEYDSLQVRSKVIKYELTESFKKSLTSHSLDYDSYNEEVPKINILAKKPEPKKIVLPASKLQPLPPDFVLSGGKWSMTNSIPVMPKIKNVMTLPSSSTLNLKVTVGSSVLTQSINTNTIANKTKLTQNIIPNMTIDPKLIMTTKESTQNDHKYASPTKDDHKYSSDTSDSKLSTQVSPSKPNSVLTFNVNSLPKDFLSSAILKVDPDFDRSSNNEASNDLENNDDQPMEIDEDCSMAVLSKNPQDRLKFQGNILKVDIEEDKSDSEYLDMKLLGDGQGQYVLGKLILQEEDGDNDGDAEEHTIVMDGSDGSILRVVSGQKLVYDEDGKLTLVPNDLDTNDNGDTQDSNDESQIELQVSGDEETANAIIAAAQEQGGAFIKVESGEMYRVESVESKTEEDSFKLETQSAMILNEDGQFRCLMCERNENKGEPIFVGDSDATMEHLKSYHSARLYICRICGHIERKRSDYVLHMEDHNAGTSSAQAHLKGKMHECVVCDKKFHTKALLNGHMNMHSGSRPYSCTICRKSFASKYTYQSHLKTHLDRPRPFKCQQCDKSFFTPQNLSQHEKTHSNVKDFVCNLCGKAFGTQHNLEVHGVVHSGSKPFVCEICRKAFARRAEVRDHMRIHTGERPFKCDVCGASFTQRSNLHSHKRATHLDDKRYHCTQCPKKFKRRRLLDYHIKASHTGERPLVCELCHATFVYPEHYKKHVRIHSGEKPYTCEVCGKSFNSRDNRNTHRFVHSDRKPYECVVCGAGYMRKQLLYHHMNTSGHLAESIVVNQPRVTKLGDNIYTTEESEKLALQDKNRKTSISLDSQREDSTLLAIRNVESELKAGDTIFDHLPDDDVNDDQSAPIRLVPIELPDGSSGWVAINA